MAEATHQQALGRYDIANSWLEVLSGHPPPGIPAFIRTYRKGQGSTHKFAMMFKQINSTPSMSPREIVEPALAEFARIHFPQFGSLTLRISVTSEVNLPTVDVNLKNDLKLKPIDLVIGGVSEVQVRLRHFVHQNLGSVLPEQLTNGAENNVVDLSFEISAAPGTESLESFVERARKIRELFQNGRALTSDDLNQAAPSMAGLLDESEQVSALDYSISKLFDRLKDLSTHFNGVFAHFKANSSPFTSAANEYVRTNNLEANSDERINAQTLLMNKTTIMAAQLPPLAAFGEPMALRPMTLSTVLADPEKFIGYIESLEQRLESKAKLIDKTLALTPTTAFQKLSEAQSIFNKLLQCLRDVTDGDATVILPPVRRNSSKLRTTLANLDGHRSTEIENWGKFRSSLGAGLDLVKAWSNATVKMVRADATLNPNEEDPDLRPENLAPSSYHFGVFAGEPSIINTNSNLCGLICDEWTEQRPSEEIVTGVAINYDTPQAEAPYCILLCVAPNNSYGNWTAQKGAEMVKEAIDWMQIRARSADESILPGSLFNNANSIAYDKAASKQLPVNSFYTLYADVLAGGLVTRLVQQGLDLGEFGVGAANLVERNGFKTVRE